MHKWHANRHRADLLEVDLEQAAVSLMEIQIVCPDGLLVLDAIKLIAAYIRRCKTPDAFTCKVQIMNISPFYCAISIDDRDEQKIANNRCLT